MLYTIKDNKGNVVFSSKSSTQSQEGIGSTIAIGAAVVAGVVGLIAATIAGIKSEEAAKERAIYVLNNLTQEDKDILSQYINNISEERYELSEDLDRIVKNAIPRDWRDLGFYYKGKINRSIYHSDVNTIAKENNRQMISLVRCVENTNPYAKTNLDLIPVVVEYPYRSNNDDNNFNQSIMGKVMRVMRNVETEITKHFLNLGNIPNSNNNILDVTFSNLSISEPSTVVFSPIISFKLDKKIIEVLNKIYSLSSKNKTF